MTILVECPECQNSYHLQPDMVGKRMRCTNPMCQHIFIIQKVASTPAAVTPEVEESPESLPMADYLSGDVNDMIPMLEAELFTPDQELIKGLSLDLDPPRAETPQRASWMTAPPPEPTEVVWSESEAPLPPNVKRHSTADHPIHLDGLDEDEEAEDDSPEPEYVSHKTRVRKQMGLGAFLALTLSVLAVGGYATYALVDYYRKAEQRQAEKAEEAYQAKDYNVAVNLYDALITQYPESERLAEYAFFQELSVLRKTVYSVLSPSEPQAAIDGVRKFDQAHVDDPMLQPDRYAFDFYETVQKAIEDVIGFADKQFQAKNYDASESALNDARGLVTILTRYLPKDVTAPNFAEQMNVIYAGIDKARERLLALTEMRRLADDPSDENLLKIEELLKTYNLSKDAEAQAILITARKNSQARIRYFADMPPVPATVPNDAKLPGLLMVGLVEKAPPPPAGTPAPSGPTSVFFALARGILYALDEAEGKVLWATRVGVDVEELPLRLAANESTPEMVLLPFNDGRRFGLSARLARTGQLLWHQVFDAPVLGRPVVVKQRLYIPLRDDKGTIAVLEIAGGTRLGRIVVNYRLGVGAAKRPDAEGLLFFPAEAQQVFVFDVEQYTDDRVRLDPVCVGILATGHLARSLRGPAYVLPGNDQTGPQPHLLLMEADGLKRLKLRSYPLPAANTPAPWPATSPVDVSMGGWPWFAPFTDGEKLAFVTERGEFGLFGVQQTGNQDPPLFPLPAKSYRLTANGLVEPRNDTPAPTTIEDTLNTRGQVVYADESHYWVLAAGHLHWLEWGITALQGPMLQQRGRPIPVGVPLHDAQVNARQDTAFVVTQSNGLAACLGTAFDVKTGKTLWVRQIGAIPQNEALALGDGVLMLDQSGGLLYFPPFTEEIPAEVEWQSEERWQVASPLRDVKSIAPLMPSSDGQSAYAVVTTGSGKTAKLVVRRFTLGQGMTKVEVPLISPLAGMPAVVGSTLVIPGEDGNLYRLRWPDGKSLEMGPSWRSEQADLASPCYCLALNDREFLASDGDKMITARRWGEAANSFEMLWQMNTIDRITRLPVLLPRADETAPLRLALTDRKGSVLLYQGAKLEQLVTAWRPTGARAVPGGTITSGPFVHQLDAKDPATVRIGYGINHRHFVWLDPGKQTSWALEGKGWIGTAHWLKGQLWLTGSEELAVVDAEAGTIVRREPLPVGLVPAASAVPIRTTTGLRWWLALTDGTAVLVPTEAAAKVEK